MRKSFRAMIVAPVVVAAARVAAAPASAQRTSLAERVALLEQQAGNNQATMDLLRQVNMLKDEVVALRAQVEELTHEQQQAREAARVQYLDLDGRLNRLEGGGAPVDATGSDEVLELGDVPGDTGSAAPAAQARSTAGAAETGPVVHGDPGAMDALEGERESYDQAFAALRAGRYDESARLFNSFLGYYPGGAWAPNALYWLGESYYVTQNYKLALEQFRQLLERFPTHDKAPGALLKVGLSQQGLQQVDEAERTLAEVSSRYPGTDAARIAEDRLGAIRLGRLN
ncbi:tol-pal system protein YbgF [Lysobacter sp. GX 14042]|uniref:tol-pal system protein YbgF n=1 Tax=Lysobacter sp. GX 14042 TaxID=2907155 RepID=UPI001F2A85C3|nr:tol-pal system protein YbgF [Lysobacter sp. GX 14042]MCE7031131.1 tol-pal system protein YbgF [Lysobacter sp. GX 14042]